MQQDNIKDFAIAAFRFYGQKEKLKTISQNDFDILFAVSLTIHHLEIDGDTKAVEGIKQVYFKLPAGKLRSNVMTNTVRRAASDMYTSEGTVWNKLRRARKLFNEYYKLLQKNNIIAAAN